MKRIAILGSTGSIGKSTLRIASHLGQEVEVVALACGSDIEMLEQQVKALPTVRTVAVHDKDKATILRGRLPGIKVLGGLEGMQEIAALPEVNFVMSAISGFAGIFPTLSAIEAGKTVALANKEVLVSAGEYVMRRVKEKGVSLIPVDSEHSALFQCLQGGEPRFVRRLVLTASGGPFYRHSASDLAGITVEKALAHPNYRMGAKVTVDSSTLMNKGLEMIEAHWLFDIPLERIEVLVHPQQFIHGFVEWSDGSIMAQASDPIMLYPIQYALTHPKRAPAPLPPFDFQKLQTLEFLPPDKERFRCLELAYEALRRGGSMPCYMNAANEVLVSQFLNNKISWIDIAQKLEKLMSQHHPLSDPSFEALIAEDEHARQEALCS